MCFSQRHQDAIISSNAARIHFPSLAPETQYGEIFYTEQTFIKPPSHKPVKPI